MPHRLSLTEAATRIRRRKLSPLALVEACLARIDAIDPEIRAWIELNRGPALDQAARLDREAAAGSFRGPLHGVPVGIKDIIFTRGIPTRAGSKFLEHHVPDHDATVVRHLKSAGAIVLGKTVTTEFAGYDPAETRNPWNLQHTPGGSSSGSAAAVAARMIPAALGSQTGGSISRPAAYCGIVGFKPSYGRVSTHGVLECARSLDHLGTLTRTVADAALLARVISGNRNEPAPIPMQAPPTLGVPHDFFFERTEPESLTIIRQALARLDGAGARTAVIRLPDHFRDVHAMHRTIMLREAATCHAGRYRESPATFQPGLRRMIEDGQRITAADYQAARSHQDAFRHDIQTAIRDTGILVTPATPTPAPRGLDSTGDPQFNSPWSHAGLPTIVIPAGLSSAGLPVAIQLIAPAGHDTALLAAAAWCEQVIGPAPIGRPVP